MPRYRNAAAPDGFVYHRDFLAIDEERELIALAEELPFREVVMRGQAARRTAIHFGFDYDLDHFQVTATAPPPTPLRALADRCAEAAGVPAESLEQFLVMRYPAGATIGWHRDAPAFGSPVIGISLLSPCTMRFRRKIAEGFEAYAHVLEPRSLYLLGGVARSHWQHSIPPTKHLRYSITMRTLRRKTPLRVV